MNGRDANFEDEDESLKFQPTRCNVLTTTNKYISNLNDPTAQKIEALLGSFNRQLHLEEIGI